MGRLDRQTRLTLAEMLLGFLTRDYKRVAADMAKAGIVVSTVSISQGAEQEILKDISTLAGGRHALLNIDVQGAASLKASGLACTRVFLLPPSMAELETRLRGRGTDDAETVARRLQIAHDEMARQGEFDLCVVNDESSRAADEIAAALLP